MIENYTDDFFFKQDKTGQTKLGDTIIKNTRWGGEEVMENLFRALINSIVAKIMLGLVVRFQRWLPNKYIATLLRRYCMFLFHITVIVFEIPTISKCQNENFEK